MDYPGVTVIAPQADDATGPDGVTRISVFDLDRTLTRRATWTPFLLFAAWRVAPWRLILFPVVLLVMVGHKAGILSRAALKQFMQRCMMGASVDRSTADGLASAFAERLVRKNCHVQGIARIAMERRNGRRVILASAANRFYLDAIAARLGITEIVGTECRWSGDALLPRIVGSNCYGDAKKDMLLAHLAKDGLDESQMAIRFYSDHLSDLPLFGIAKEAIAVNPSRKLRKIADDRGWPVLRWS